MCIYGMLCFYNLENLIYKKCIKKTTLFTRRKSFFDTPFIFLILPYAGRELRLKVIAQTINATSINIKNASFYIVKTANAMRSWSYHNLSELSFNVAIKCVTCSPRKGRGVFSLKNLIRIIYVSYIILLFFAN